MGVATLAELQLPSGTLYEATVEGVEDGSGNEYTGRLAGHPQITRALSDETFGFIRTGRVSVTLSAAGVPAVTAVPQAASIRVRTEANLTKLYTAGQAWTEQVSIPNQPSRIAVAVVTAQYTTADSEADGVPSGVVLEQISPARTQAFTKAASQVTTAGATRIASSLWYLLNPWHDGNAGPLGLWVKPTTSILTAGNWTLQFLILAHAAQEAPTPVGTAATATSPSLAAVVDGTVRVDGIANDRTGGAGITPDATGAADGMHANTAAENTEGDSALGLWVRPVADTSSATWEESGATVWAVASACFAPLRVGALARDPVAANALAAIFRATEARGAVAILRRKNMVTGALSTRFTGQIDAVIYTGTAVQLALTDTAKGVLDAPMPVTRITEANYAAATGANVDLDATVPVHLGAHREHSPCRYVEEDFVRDRFLYVVGGELVNGAVPSVCASYVNDIYLGTQLGAVRLSAGEFSVVRDSLLADIVADDITLTEEAGGTIPDTTSIDYYVVAYNGVHRTKGFLKNIVISGGANRQVAISWPQRDFAIGYEVYKDGDLLVRRHGATLLSFTDTGLTPDATYPVPTVNATGTWALCVRFYLPAYSGASALAPVLADVEYTELGVDANTSALWLFRGDLQDVSGHRNHLHLAILGTGIAHWVFDQGATDFVTSLHTSGTENQLTGVNIGYAQFREGQHGASAWNGDIQHANWQIDNATTVGMQFGATTSFQVTAKIRPKPMSHIGGVVSFAPDNSAGWRLMVKDGRVHAYVRQAANEATVLGTSRLDRAWHIIGMDVNRTTNIMSVFVDGVVEGTVDISAVGGLTQLVDRLYVGVTGLNTQWLVGDIEWAKIASKTSPIPIQEAGYVNGKANQSRSALDFETIVGPLTIRDDKSTGLDQTTTDFTIEGWVRLTQAVASVTSVVAKHDGTTGAGFGLELGTDEKLTMELRKATVGVQDSVQSSNAFVEDKWTYFAAVVTRETGGSAGQILIDIDGTETTVAISAATAYSLSNSDAWFMGYDFANTNSLDAMQIDELRISSVARTAAERREARMTGKRNAIRQARSLLEADVHGPGLTLDATTWNTAEDALDAVESGALVTGMAIVEELPTHVHLAEFLRIRGARLGLTSAGAWTCVIDTQQTPSGVFGRHDGDAENAAPTWTGRALSATPDAHEVSFRRRRFDVGTIDRFLLTTTARTILAAGEQGVRRITLGAVRDITTADIIADALAEREVLADEAVEFPTGEDGLDKDPGDVVTVKDAITGVTSQAVEIREIRERGGAITIRGVPWASSIYTYNAETLPADPNPESGPDFESVLPPAPTALAGSYNGTTSIDLTWTDPASANFTHLALAWKPSTGTLWREAGIAERGDESFTLMATFAGGTDYDFRVQAVNAAGFRSVPLVLPEQTA